MSMRRTRQPPPPCAIVIFGANGDLTKRLIVPALYNLARTGLLPQQLGADRAWIITTRPARNGRPRCKDFLAQ